MYDSLEECREAIRKRKSHFAIFCKNIRPNGNLVYIAVERHVTESLISIWPRGEDGEWRYVETVWKEKKINS